MVWQRDGVVSVWYVRGMVWCGRSMVWYRYGMAEVWYGIGMVWLRYGRGVSEVCYGVSHKMLPLSGKYSPLLSSLLGTIVLLLRCSIALYDNF